jgi:hypothetical protein
VAYQERGPKTGDCLLTKDDETGEYENSNFCSLYTHDLIENVVKDPMSVTEKTLKHLCKEMPFFLTIDEDVQKKIICTPEGETFTNVMLDSIVNRVVFDYRDVTITIKDILAKI